MKINPKNGVDKLLFGMKQTHVEAMMEIVFICILIKS
jgi:hypothetical protein